MRASLLTRQLTLDEKVAILHQFQPAIQRLGLDAFHTGQEILHGVGETRQGVAATVFPQSIGLGATWNPDLLEAIGSAIGDELRELHEQDSWVSLNAWGPVINLLRDPRWGRNEEGYSEDPFLTSVLAVSYCRGLRGGGAGETPAVLKTAPTIKHFLAYNHEETKFHSSAGIRARVLWEYEMRVFEWTIKSGAVSALMPSYNQVNGRPCHVSSYFALLRRWQQDLVIVSDAYAPIGLVEDSHFYDDRPHAYAAAIRAGLDSFTCENRHPQNTIAAINEAIARGLLGEPEVDAAARRLLTLRMRLGEFDSPERHLGAGRTRQAVDVPEHRSLAREAARQAVVLLKNEAATLPLEPVGLDTLAVIGPHSDKLFRDWYSGEFPYEVTCLDGLRSRLPKTTIRFVEGVDRVALRLWDGTYLTGGDGPEGAPLRASPAAQGGMATNQCFDVFDWGQGVFSLRCAANARFLKEYKDGRVVNDQLAPNGWNVYETFHLIADGSEWVLRSTKRPQQKVWYLGVGGAAGVLSMTAETAQQAVRFSVEPLSSGVSAARDCAASAAAAVMFLGSHPLINGRECQDRKELALPPAQLDLARAVLQASKRTAVVLVSSAPLAVPELAELAPALLWSCHAGPEMGTAISDVLTGGYSPAGRLQQTWYRDVSELGDILDYDIIKAGKTYMYFRGTPLFPFGHGLSYAEFRYGDLRLGHSVAAPDDNSIEISLDVTNISAVDSDEVVQLYVKAPGEAVPRPSRELRGFRRVPVRAGATVTVAFELSTASLAYWDVSRGCYAVEPGQYTVMVGRSSSDIAVTAALTVTDDPRPARSVSDSLVRAADFDDYSNVRLVAETKASGDAVECLAPGGWLMFRDVDLGRGAAQLLARVVPHADRAAVIEARLHDPLTGPVVARLTVPPSGGEIAWTTVTAPASGVTGHGDLYLTFFGAARLACFALTR